jgi:hypothetical protein
MEGITAGWQGASASRIPDLLPPVCQPPGIGHAARDVPSRRRKDVLMAKRLLLYLRPQSLELARMETHRNVTADFSVRACEESETRH